MKFLGSTKKKIKKFLSYAAITAFVTNVAFVPLAMAKEGEREYLLAGSPSIVINEIIPNPSSGNEWVELYNKSMSSINLSGWKLKDDAGNEVNIQSVVLEPNEYLIVYFSSNILNNSGDSLYLISKDSETINTVTYKKASKGKSYARKPNAGDVWKWVSSHNVTKGWNNNAPSAPELKRPNNNYMTDESEVKFSWEEVTDPDGDDVTYTLELSENENFSPISQSGETNDDSLTLNINSGKYYWRVKAFGEDNNFSTSEIRNLTVDTIAPEILEFSASTKYFSPNNDDVKDTVEMSYEISEVSDVLINIYDTEDNVVKTFQDNGTNSGFMVWNGKDKNGNQLTKGTFTAVLTAKDQVGNETSTTEETSLILIIDLEAPDATYDSYVLDPNPTKNNNPLVLGKYHEESEIASIGVIFEGVNATYEKMAQFSNGLFTTDNNLAYKKTSVKDTVILTEDVNYLPDGIYKVYIRAYDEAGNYAVEEVENGKSLQIDTVAPSAPLNVQVIAKDPGSITLQWNANSETDLQGYRIYWGIKGSGFNNIIDVGNNTTYTVKGLSSLTDYQFKVTAYDKALNEGLASDVVETRTTQVLIASATSSSTNFPSTNSSMGEAPKEEGGKVESATDENLDKQEEPKEDSQKEEEAQTKGRNNLFLFAVIMFVLGIAGYYYFSVNSNKFKNFKFPKFPKPPGS